MAERKLSICLSVVDGGKVKVGPTEIGEKGACSLKKNSGRQPTRASSDLKLLSSAANDTK